MTRQWYEYNRLHLNNSVKLTLYLMHAMFSKMVAFHFRELAFFYPDFVAPTIVQKRKKKRLQRTLALIRPDALRTRKGNLAYLNSKSN